MIKAINILLIDDHALVRAGFRSLCESEQEMHIVAEAENGRIGYQLFQEHQPDVIILDLNMPGIDGFETMHRIKSKCPNPNILMCSGHDNIFIVQRSLKFGASGFVSKHNRTEEIIPAIRQVYLGKKYIGENLLPCRDIDLCKECKGGKTYKNPLESLTKREFQIFRLTAEGRSCRQIADQLSLSTNTVGVHLHNMTQKLKLDNSSQIIRLALNWDVIQ